MARIGILFCALLLSGCNSILPGASAPQASAPPETAPQASTGPEGVGVIVPPPVADLDCAPRKDAISCN